MKIHFPDKVCVNCGKEITGSHIFTAAGVFCDAECYAEAGAAEVERKAMEREGKNAKKANALRS